MQDPGRPGITIPLNRVRRARDFGAKAAAAARLLRSGFAVPDGFCISADAYRAHLWNTGNRSLARHWSDEPDFDALHNAIINGKIPPDIRAAIESAYRSLGADVVVAVRHSASDEEIAGAAYATVLGARGISSLAQAVKTVWASLWTEEAVELRQLAGGGNEPVMAVLVQVMVDSVVSGTASAANPVTGNPNEVVVRSTWGVFNEAEAADESIVNLGDFRVTASEINRKEELTLLGPEGLEIGPAPAELVEASSLAASEAVELAEMVIWTEKPLGMKPVILWANDGRQFHILSARPMTELPDFFPIEPRPGVWRLVDPKPISGIARSIAGPLACWNGRAYGRVDAPSASGGLRLYRKFLKQTTRLSAQARRMLAALSDQPTPVVAADIGLAGRKAILTSHWMSTALQLRETSVTRLRDFLSTTPAEPALIRRLLLGCDASRHELDAAIQNIGAYAWQSDSGGSHLRQKVSDLAAMYGHSFTSSPETVDPAAWRNWVEDQEQMLKVVRALARGPAHDVELAFERSRTAADLARKEATAAVNWSRGFIRRPFARVKLRMLLRRARAWSAAAGKAQQVHALTLSALRANLLEFGSRLAESGILSSPEDIFSLKLDELRSVRSKMNSAQLDHLRRILANRKHEMWLESRLTAARLISDTDFPDPEPTPPSTARILVGTPVWSGEAIGRALVASKFDEALELQPGDILIADRIAPAWTPLLSLAAGLVISAEDPFGASSAAADIGIPCVIVKGAASAARTGQIVKLDGAAGVVEIVKRTGSLRCGHASRGNRAAY